MSQRTIFFVDDEQAVLDGLRRSLRDLRNDWRMEFFSGAAPALAAMATTPPDVVVSDMQMPGMDGEAFLTKVQQQKPSTVRLVLSGHAAFDAVARVMRIAHQVLSKPCDTDHLRKVLGNLRLLCDRLQEPAMVDAIGGLGALPSIPAVLQQLMEALEEPGIDQRQIAAMIKLDPGLSVRVLQVANSGYFAARSRIESVEQAVVMLGAQMLRNLVLQVKIVEAFPSQNSHFSMEAFGRRVHCVTQLARRIGGDDVSLDQARELAMTVDVGQLVLAARLPARYDEVLEEWRATGEPLVAVEHRVFGANHAEVGAHLMGLWGQDVALVGRIGGHHTPSTAGADQDLVGALHVAEALVESDGDESRFRRCLEPGFLERSGREADVPQWLAWAGEFLTAKAP
jgi:HD-like signal output (HDOD) protein/ActR/RegA family two-component response regulator